MIDRMMWLAGNASMHSVRATTNGMLDRMKTRLAEAGPHGMTLAQEIERFMERPHAPAEAVGGVNAPPGAPIGQPAMNWMIGSPSQDWLSLTEPWCTWDNEIVWN